MIAMDKDMIYNWDGKERGGVRKMGQVGQWLLTFPKFDPYQLSLPRIPCPANSSIPYGSPWLQFCLDDICIISGCGYTFERAFSDYKSLYIKLAISLSVMHIHSLCL